ncbi:hypothetical protein [Ulvibacterium marinum]|uniref:Uncharacterized protein n=1 Tax=Ulvibacterium marinum TaxID=2419782 RepID=A0A3B0BX44_9FLAO|nr:hypothetical protein [Ulvibacterium marinum]RKN76814.1 hypothetical protein D7Z94_23825 [Ulvibacterium marinum]
MVSKQQQIIVSYVDPESIKQRKSDDEAWLAAKMEERGFDPLHKLGLLWAIHRRDTHAEDNSTAFNRISKDALEVGGPLLEAYGAAQVAKVNRLKNLTKVNSIDTPYGAAIQSSTKSAQEARVIVENGGSLYRIGTLGKSHAAEAQFWALENPLENPQAFSKKYGIPIENIENADFIEIGTLNKGNNFITRPAPAAPGSATNSGGGIEVVTPSGAVELQSFHVIKKK